MIIPFRKRSAKRKILSHAGILGLITLGAVILSYLFVDRPLAKFASHLPPLFFAVNCLLTYLIDPKVNYLIWPLVYFFLRFIAKKPKKAEAIFILILAIPLADVASGILKWIMGRPRPELYLSQGLYGFNFIKLSNLFQSFPSGHATTAGVIGGVFSCFRPQFTVPIMAGCFIFTLTRVFVEMHYFSDILAGLFLGALIGQWLHMKLN